MKKNEELGEQREAWHRMATRCAAKIRERCGATLDKETAEKIARVFRAALIQRKKAGRKPDHETVRAAELWVRHSKKKQQRQLWQRIYREVIPGYARLDKLTRQYRTSLLRRNVKSLPEPQEKGRKSACGIRDSSSILSLERVVFLLVKLAQTGFGAACMHAPDKENATTWRNDA